MIRNTLPLGLVDNPRLDQWIGFEASGRVRVATGKVELGQGILTALQQIAAEELDVAPERIDMVSGDTMRSPSEGYTAGSLSVENSGGSIRLVAAEVRAMMLDAAAIRLGCSASEISVADGVIMHRGVATGLDYWVIAPAIDLTLRASGTAPVKLVLLHTVVGRSLPRLDLPDKIFARASPFIQDLRFTGLIHGRVIRQPWPGAVADVSVIAHTGDDCSVIVKGNFVAVTAPTEIMAIRAAERLAMNVRWSGGTPHALGQSAPGWIAGARTTDSTTDRGPPPITPNTAANRLTRRYNKQFLAHASIGPSCALAHFEGGRLTVWTHAQGVFLLRGAIARAVGLEPAAIHVIHKQGSGCYGHNGADDVACDAAVIAMTKPGVHVRVQWSREDELSASPLGSAMTIEISAELTASGTPTHWSTEIWSGPHAQRPGANGGVNLLAADAMPNPPQRPFPQELPETSGYSGMRNAPLLYDIPHQRLINHIAAEIVPRTSSMRGLGAFANVFAIESFIDELAAEAGLNSIQYRLSHASDPRARSVMEKVATMAGWGTMSKRGEGTGRGFAYSRYNRAGYLALVVDVRVDDEVRLEHVWCAVDAGLVINPDGVRNQVEGGIIQAASWALKEDVTFADGRIALRSWDDYPILRFSEVPTIDIWLMEQPDEPTLGVGEVAQGPMGAAIANAVADALGVRIRDLPLSRERIISALNA